MLRFATVAFAIAVFAFAQNVQAQESVMYDPATGAVTFMALENAGALQLGGPGVPATDPDPAGGLVEVNGEMVTWAFLLGSKNGDLPAGELLPAGLFQDQLDGDYIAGVVITGSGNPDMRPIPFTGGLIIPEPTTLLLAGLGMIGLVAMRRRSA
jgi:hypothetical protein